MNHRECLLAITLLFLSPTIVHALPIFETNLNTGQVVSPPATPLGATGTATFELNLALMELSYTIVLSNNLILSMDPPNETQNNAVTKIHFHFGAVGVTGPHVLNVFGLPSEDDDDLTINFLTNTLSGTWGDPGDLLGDPNLPGSTKAFPDFLSQLLSDQLYVAVHTVNAGGNVEIRGQIERVPEPGTLILVSMGLFGLLGSSLRRKIC